MENIVYVTDLVKRYSHPFDVELWSTYKALEELLDSDTWIPIRKKILEDKKITPEYLTLVDSETLENKKLEIQERWREENEKALEYGTAKHKEMEELFSSSSSISFEDLGIEGTFNYTPGDNIQDGINPEISLRTEVGNFILAGRADLLIKKDNKITIVDYKFDKAIDKKGHFNQKVKNMIRMLYPINTITDSNYWHYTLLLSLYAYIVLQNNPAYEIENLYIKHFNRMGKSTVYKVDYLKDEVLKLLQFYSKQFKLDQRKERRKPIVY